MTTFRTALIFSGLFLSSVTSLGAMSIPEGTEVVCAFENLTRGNRSRVCHDVCFEKGMLDTKMPFMNDGDDSIIKTCSEIYPANTTGSLCLCAH